MMSVDLHPGEREARINGTVLEAILQNQSGNPSNRGSQYMWVDKEDEDSDLRKMQQERQEQTEVSK